MAKFRLGQTAKGKDFQGRVVARVEYEDGRRLCLVVSKIIEHGVPPQQEWIAEDSLSADLPPVLTDEEATSAAAAAPVRRP